MHHVCVSQPKKGLTCHLPASVEAVLEPKSQLDTPARGSACRKRLERGGRGDWTITFKDQSNFFAAS